MTLGRDTPNIPHLTEREGVHKMPARKPRPPDEKPQRERFIEAAREHGVSEDPEDFERAFRQVVKPRTKSQPSEEC
jgi:hypothetical protein